MYIYIDLLLTKDLVQESIRHWIHSNILYSYKNVREREGIIILYYNTCIMLQLVIVRSIVLEKLHCSMA
jgi:hypothetical protein